MRTRREVYQSEIDRAADLGDMKGVEFWAALYDDADIDNLLDFPAPFDVDDQGNLVSLVHMLPAVAKSNIPEA